MIDIALRTYEDFDTIMPVLITMRFVKGTKATLGFTKFKPTRVIELEGHTIGITHDLLVPGMAQEVTGFSPLSKHFPKNADLSTALATVFDAAVDIVIFGHTHYPVVEEFQGVLMVNPGSPSLPKQLRRLGQVAILELGPTHKSAEILDLSTFS